MTTQIEEIRSRMLGEISYEKRMRILEKEIKAYTRLGYHITSRTDFSVSMMKNNGTSLLRWLTLGIFAFMGRKERSVYVSVSPRGRVSRISH